ncbi:MAG: tetratricopeptide repeat protein [Desulfohalobiaceae bacterium]
MTDKSYSRRDLLLGLFGKLRGADVPGGKTGFSSREREIDALLKQGDYAAAIPQLEELLQISPDHIQARQKLGYCLLQNQRPEAAAREMQTALQEKPGDNFCLLYLGLALAWQDDLEQALYYWEQYFDPGQTLIQREINLVLALQDTSGLDSGREIAQRLEQAISRQHKKDQGQ